MQDELLRKSRKKRCRKIAIALVLIIFSATAAITLRLRSTSESTGPVTDGGGGRASISILCKELTGNFSKLKNKNLKKYIPGDGVILKKTEVDFEKDDTVYDILKRICRQKDIAFIKEQKTGYSGIYIKSLGHLAEFDAGKKSGWMYTVNGEYPNLSCSQYKLGNRDKVVWHYVVDYRLK